MGLPGTDCVALRQKRDNPSSASGTSSATRPHHGRILVLDAALGTARALHALLRGQGYTVECADSCVAGVKRLTDLQPDVIITDWVLPDLRGTDLCGHLRTCSQAAVMVVSRDHSEDTCATALHAGADDYVVMPWRAKELIARVAALVRRVTHPSDEVVAAGDVTIDLHTREVKVGDRRVRLRPHEFDLLLYLARRPSEVLPYRTLLAAVWGPSVQLRPHYVRMCVAHLRRQIEPTPTQPRYLLTERSIGYRLEPMPARHTHSEPPPTPRPGRLAGQPATTHCVA
jgi:two-component system, OmpR family, KDP operon response regulator KdpE